MGGKDEIFHNGPGSSYVGEVSIDLTDNTSINGSGATRECAEKNRFNDF